MNFLHGVWSVFRFEWKRNFTLPRLATVLGLAIFPAAIVALQVFVLGVDLSDPKSGETLLTLFFTIPGVVCLMALLLWATPVISSELEGKTWVYIAIRPGGPRAVLIGKYLNAIAWTIPTALLALTLCTLIAQPTPWLRMWLTFAAISVLSSITYGAIFTLFGVLFLKRAMVIAAAYTVGMEVVVSFIPATINQFTVHYRLRTLMTSWLDIPVEDKVAALFDSGPIYQQVAILLGVAIGLMLLATVILQSRELARPDAG